VNVHEYQAKALFREYGVPVPDGELATTPAEAAQVARNLGTDVVVVKAQVHAGGRGKGGGVKLANSPADAEKAASEILGMTLHTPQTPPEGKLVRKVYLEAGSAIARELYLAILLDRAAEKFAIVVSTEGGMQIEVVAAESPEKILTVLIDPNEGLHDFQARKLAFGLGLAPDQIGDFVSFVRGLYRLYVEKDCTQVEINPLVITTDKRLLALDGKVSIDDNALFKHPDIQALRDVHEEEPLEIEAGKHNLSYVKLDGDIACMVNGAGLAMATMDVIKLAGTEPANFLDVGGGATKETVAAGFRILLKDKKVKGVFINIFGGIVRCERIAHGVIDAAKEVGIRLPVVVRLQGTNAEEGRQLLLDSGLKVDVATDLWEAAQKIVGMRRKKKG